MRVNRLFYLPGIKHVLGVSAGAVLFPLAEKIMTRRITSNVNEIEGFFQLNLEEQRRFNRLSLYRIVSFAASNVKYYKDLFKAISFDVEKLAIDAKYIEEIPFLTKEIVFEQGARLLSDDLDHTSHRACFTGGSTGESLAIYYDDVAADRSAAVTRYCRKKLKGLFHNSELHFACDFGDKNQQRFFQRETLKCAAHNRSNIFFSDVGNESLSLIAEEISLRRPFMVHGHPSTLFFLAEYLEDHKEKAAKYFDVFEPSGEYCSKKMKQKICKTFGCRLHNRSGLAEFGVGAYQFDPDEDRLRVIESDFFVENFNQGETAELVITSFHNKLMPLIRYRTGDLATVQYQNDGQYLHNIMGRIHDRVIIGEKTYLTHHVQDVIDHKIGGIRDWQITSSKGIITFLIFELNCDDRSRIENQIKDLFCESVSVRFVKPEQFHKVGRHQKFRYLVNL